MKNSTNLQQIDIDLLIPYINNARTHSPEQVKKIRASLREFGFVNWKFCIQNDNYVATECGNIARICREQKSKSGNILRKYEVVLLNGSIDRYGYKTYRMLVNGRKKHLKAHRLICSAFWNESDLCVNHKNGIKIDNRLENLEYVSVAENNQHAIISGLWKPKKGINAKIQSCDFVTIYLMIKHLGYKRQDIARANRVCRQTIDKIFNRMDVLLKNA